MSDVTRILSKIESGDPSAAEQLLTLVFDELRKLAAARLAQEAPRTDLLFVETIDASRRILGEDHPKTLKVVDNLAALYLRQWRQG